MSEQESAAQEEGIDLTGGEDQPVTLNEPEATPESAPEGTEAQPEVKEDGFQKRINKVTADKYTERRRADEAERKLEELRANTPAVSGSAPKLEDFDYDQDKFTQALISHQVEQALTANAVTQKDDAAKISAQQAQVAFNDRIVNLGKADFEEVANAVPQLPNGVADALVQSDNGAELIYHLGTHLDLADKLANMTSSQAIMELGRISANMSAQPEQKLSAAPDPIEPLNSGGSISQERGPQGATFT